MSLVGFDCDAEAELSDWVNEAGGDIVFSDFGGLLDYLVVPPEGCCKPGGASSLKLQQCLTTSSKKTQVVNSFWLEDCLDSGELIVRPAYFHRPVFDGEVDTLRNMEEFGEVVIGITNYAGRERTYISMLAEALGMVAQETFAKRDKKGAKRSTHLVCGVPEGQKYEAGLKWGIPVVDKDWLLACRRDGRFVNEKRFLVGEATVYTSGKPDPSSEPQDVASGGEDSGSKDPEIQQIRCALFTYLMLFNAGYQRELK